MKFGSFELKENKWGFYQVAQCPTEEELARYYQEKYYQDSPDATYCSHYSQEELEYIAGKMEEKVYCIRKLVRGGRSSFLDIGCGEGFALSHLKKAGFDVYGLDFSSYGINNHNSEMMAYFKQGDIFESCKELIASGKRFSVVNMDNVLEHVRKPLEMVKLCYELLLPEGIFIVDVPNDFNPLQNFLVKEGYIKNKKWVGLPDHLSYFNRDGLLHLCQECGFKREFVMCTEFIEFLAMNPETNYYDHPETGHGCHLGRMRQERLLREISLEKKMKLQRVMGELEIGRNLVGIFRKAGN